MAVGVWAVLLGRAARPSGSGQIHSCLLRRGHRVAQVEDSMILLEGGNADRALFTRGGGAGMTADLYAWHTATDSMVNGSVGGPPGHPRQAPAR